MIHQLKMSTVIRIRWLLQQDLLILQLFQAVSRPPSLKKAMHKSRGIEPEHILYSFLSTAHEQVQESMGCANSVHSLCAWATVPTCKTSICLIHTVMLGAAPITDLNWELHYQLPDCVVRSWMQTEGIRSRSEDCICVNFATGKLRFAN